MSNQLQENLDAILLDKNTNLKPENLKAGITCLGIEGTLVSGDFGSITAVPADVKKGKKFIDSTGVLRKGTFPDISYSSSSMMSSYSVVESDLDYRSTSYYRDINLTKQFNGLIYNSFNGKLSVKNSNDVLVELELTEKPYIMSVGCKDVFDENSVLIACTYSDRIDFYMHNYVDNTLGSFGTINASDYDMQPDSEGNFYPVCFLSPYYNFISISWGIYDNTNKSFCWVCKLNSDLSFDKVQKIYGNTASNRGSYFSFTFWVSKDLIHKGYGSLSSSGDYLSLIENSSISYLYGDGASNVKIDSSIISVDMDQKYCITNPSSSKTYHLRTLVFSSSNVELGDIIKTFTVTNRTLAMQTVIQGDLIVSADYINSNYTSKFYKLDRNTNSVTEIAELIPNCHPDPSCGNLMFRNYGSKEFFYILVETIQNITSMSYDNKSFINTSDATATPGDIAMNKIAYISSGKVTGTGLLGKNIYGALDYTSKTYTVKKIGSSSSSPYPRTYIFGKLALRHSYNTQIYIYYDGEFIGEYTCKLTGNKQKRLGVVYYDDEQYIFIVNNEDILTTNYEAVSVNYITKTITDLGQISTIDETSFGQTDTTGKECIFAGNYLYRYQKDTNTFKKYNKFPGSFVYFTGNNFAIYKDISTEPGHVSKFTYDELSDTYNIISVQQDGVDGVSFYGNKIFMNGNVYTLNADLSVGELLAENVYTVNQSIDIYFLWINEKYVIYDSVLYYWDDTNNTFTKYIPMKYANLSGYVIASDNVTVTQYTFTNSEEIIGVNINGRDFYFNQGQIGGTSDEVLFGKTVYTSGADVILGTMPNNGDVTIAPTTSEQTKEQGYYNSLKVSAVTSAIDSNIIPENIKKDITILDVVGTYEGSGTASEIEITTAIVDETIQYIPYKEDGTSLWNTSSMTDMYEFAKDCVNLKDIPLLNTSSVTDMSYMFDGCTSLTTISLLDTSSVTAMQEMFYGCSSLITIPQLNTSSVENTMNMFDGCTSLITIPLIDTSNVTSMSSMFDGCTTLITIPQLNISSAEEVNNMFNNCTSLTTIPQLDTSSAIDMSSMFSNCTALVTVPQLNMNSADSITNIFANCNSLSNDSLNNILASLLTATSYSGTKTLARIGLSSTQATTCTTLANWSACESAGWTTGY